VVGWQINGVTQRQIEATPFQAIYEQTPFMLVLMPVLAPMFDDLSFTSETSFWRYHWTFNTIV
jgi:hypothetical protein